MKKLLLVIGIILLAVGVISLLLAAWHWYSYYHVMDGSAALFARLQRRAIPCCVGCSRNGLRREGPQGSVWASSTMMERSSRSKIPEK